MSSIGSPSPFFLAGKKAYEVERSLRFNDGDSANLTRTSSSTSTTFTYSAWIKRCTFTGYQYIFSLGSRGFSFHTNNNTFYLYDGSNLNESTAKFRDPSAWYHIVVQINSGVATSYVNNVLVHNAVGSGFTFTTGSNETRIGVYASGDYYFDGYQAEINLVDGSVVAPSSFAETDAITGQWNPKKYVGSYGTNGFYLNFSDNSGTTATTLGKDSSGNGNNFTPNNFSVASSLSNDSMPDTPSNNFCTLNPLNATSSFNFGAGEGNLVFDQSSNDQAITGTFFVTSGKWYWEIYKNSGQNPELGIVPQFAFSAQSNGIGCTTDVAFITNGGNLRNGNNGTASITGGSAQTGAGWIRIAVDMDNKKIWFSDTSGNYFNSGNPATGANAAFDFSSVEVANGWTPSIFMGTGSGHNCYVNFGQFELNSFSSNIPAGFKTLSSANLPDPTIKLPNKHFNTLLYSGTGSSNPITGLNFAPDWVWAKRRNASGNHHLLIDQVRGGDKSLSSNLEDAENSNANRSMTFNSNGVTWNSDTGNANASGGTYALWNWNAGDTDSATYTVKVVSDGGNKYRFNNFGTSAVTLDLAEGGTYTFDGSDSSMSGHPFVIGTAANGTVYSTGVTYQLDGASVTYSAYTSGYASASTRKLIITVPASAPVLYYWCSIHSGMGGQVNTNSTLGSSNFSGTTQALAKVNATAGFSIVTYTGTGSTTTVGHGLGVAPQVVFTKARNGAYSWAVLHTVGDPNAEYGLFLNDNGGYSSHQGNFYWNDTVPTSSVFTVKSKDQTNRSGTNYIAYCLSEVAGYSKFGKYTGNGNADGTFVFTGFRPAWVLIKATSTSENWRLFDNKRNTFNQVNKHLVPSTSSAESTETGLDFAANGFKFRDGDGHQNGSGHTYIYLAFAESPFKNARAR